MLHILVCEDDSTQRTRIENIIGNHLLSGEYDMALVLSTASPDTLLDYLEAHKGQSGLYFLDVDLQSHINGIELAAKIKKMDVAATIVFITTHSEMVHYVFKLKIEAMEYILKDSPPEEIKERIIECIQTAYQRFLEGKHSQKRYFTARAGSQKVNIPWDDIMYFETSTNQRNKILLHKVNGEVEFYGTVADVSSLGPPFYQCYQSFVVNINHVKHVDIPGRRAEMTDGTFVPISRERMAEFLKHLG